MVGWEEMSAFEPLDHLPSLVGSASESGKNRYCAQ